MGSNTCTTRTRRKTASQQIEAGIRANPAGTDVARGQEVMQPGRLEKIRDAVTRDLRARVPDAVIEQRIPARTAENLDLNLPFPTLRHEAWDVAVANPSASGIEHDRMQRYPVAYARQRDILASMNADVALLMNDAGLVGTVADLLGQRAAARPSPRGQPDDGHDRADGEQSPACSRSRSAAPCPTATAARHRPLPRAGRNAQRFPDCGIICGFFPTRAAAMHLELPKVRLESARDFLKHYLMIVLSILTALGLEAWIEHAHHEHAAQTASTQIEAEIRANLAEVDVALAQDEQREHVLGALRDRMIADFRAHAPEAAITEHVRAMTAHGFNLNLRWPTLRHEAWDVAVANQSASWIEHERMRRYSAAYASQRDMGTNLDTNIALIMNGPRMLDTMTDLRVGDVRPRELLYVTGQMATMLGQAQDGLRVLQKHLREALVETPRQ